MRRLTYLLCSLVIIGLCTITFTRFGTIVTKTGSVVSHRQPSSAWSDSVAYSAADTVLESSKIELPESSPHNTKTGSVVSQMQPSSSWADSVAYSAADTVLSSSKIDLPESSPHNTNTGSVVSQKQPSSAWADSVAYFAADTVLSSSNIDLPESSPHNKTNIVILVLADEKSQQSYAANIASLKCYGELNGYTTKIFSLSESCRRSVDGFFFQRQCEVIKTMLEMPSMDWFLVLDADIAVVNMNHKLEQFLRNDKDVVHMLRFHNNEVAAGSYLIRNSEWGRDYLTEWVGLHPGNKSKHGYSGMNADNGALHWLLLHRLADSRVGGWSDCLKVGKLGANYNAFVTCFHHVVKQTLCQGHDWDHIAIVPHAQYVAYDGWVTYYKWSDDTFMHHAMKNPPISSRTCCTRPLKGRLMPTFTCDPSAVTRTDDWYVSPDEYKILMEETQAVERKKHNPRSWDEESCVQNGKN